MPASFSDIFTPVEGDYALITLRRVLGCTVDAVWTGGTCAEAGMISAAFGWFNLAVGIVAGLLTTYTVWTAMADTARDGEAFGSGISMPYTVARVSMGVIMLLPVAGGFSIMQLIVIQLLVWGSGGADMLWSNMSARILGGGYSQVAALDRNDARMRGMIATAIQTRALGHVCAARLNEIATDMRKGSPMQPADNAQGYSGAWFGLIGGKPASRSYFFKDVSGVFNGTQSLCGMVTFNIGKGYDFPASNSPMNAQDQATYETLKAIANSAVNTGLQNVWSEIDQSARAIAQAVVNGQKNDAEVQDLIVTGVGAAQEALTQAINATVSGGESNIRTLAQQYLSQTSDAGWIFAVSWQRAGISMTQAFQSIVNSVTITSTPPGSLATALQPMAMPYRTSGQLSGSIFTTIAAAYERDMGFLVAQNGFVANLASQAPIGIGGEQGIPTQSMGISGLMQWVMGLLTVEGDNDKIQFSDPLINLVKLGSGLANWGFYALALGGAAEAGSYLLGPLYGAVASGASSALWFVGVIFVGAGFWLGGVLPMAPLLYFFGAVISWLVVGLEALVAVPLWVLTHFFPAREPSLIGASRQGYLLLFGLLMRPILIIIGLGISVSLMFGCFVILNIMFRSAFSLMMPIDGGGTTSALMAAAIIVTYMTAATIVVTNCCAFISEGGDAALRWIEIGVQSLWNARFGGDVMQPMNPAGGVSGIGRQLGGAGAGIPSNLRRVNADKHDRQRRQDEKSNS